VVKESCLFDLSLVNTHILHYKKNRKTVQLEVFFKMVAASLLNGVGQEILEQAWIISAHRFNGRDCFPCRIMATQTKVKRPSH
jgi:hypothetical protein